jgi:vacuolar protein sorting-associated protein 26
MAAYFFASPIDVDVKLEGEDLRKQVEMKGEKDKAISCPVYYDGDSVTGQVCRFGYFLYEMTLLSIL